MLIALVEQGQRLLAIAIGVRQRLLGRLQLILPGRDLLLGDIDQIGVDLGFVNHQLFDQRTAVFRVEDGEATFIAQVHQLAANNIQPQVMKSRNRQPPRRPSLNQRANPLLHLPRRFIGKGHRRNIAARHPALVNQIGNFAGDHTRLATARTGEHQQGPVDIVHRFLLLGIECRQGRRPELCSKGGAL